MAEGIKNVFSKNNMKYIIKYAVPVVLILFIIMTISVFIVAENNSKCGRTGYTLEETKNVLNENIVKNKLSFLQVREYLYEKYINDYKQNKISDITIVLNKGSDSEPSVLIRENAEYEREDPIQGEHIVDDLMILKECGINSIKFVYGKDWLDDKIFSSVMFFGYTYPQSGMIGGLAWIDPPFTPTDSELVPDDYFSSNYARPYTFITEALEADETSYADWYYFEMEDSI